MVNQTGHGYPTQCADNEGCRFVREENMVYKFIPSARGACTCTECPIECTKFRELATDCTTVLALKAKCNGCGLTAGELPPSEMLTALASSGENLQWMCDLVEKYCGDTGMKINVTKSAWFNISSKHKTFVVNEGTNGG